MKSKDKFTLIAIAVFSGVASIILSGMFIGGDGNKDQTVEVITPITAELQVLPTEYYNSNAVNPTQTIEIGGENTRQPFGSQ
jgi:hypothetical protein